MIPNSILVFASVSSLFLAHAASPHAGECDPEPSAAGAQSLLQRAHIEAAGSLRHVRMESMAKASSQEKAHSRSLEECRSVAAQFRNTCDQLQESVSDMAAETVRCEAWPANKECIGLQEDGACVWERRLCVTCFSDDADGATKVRVQTNNMPDHCIGNALAKPQNFDYEVLFNAKQSSSELVQEFSTQAELDTEVCRINHGYTKSSLRMIEHGTVESKRSLAFAINGVAFQVSNQIGQDPVAPIDHDNEQPLDICLGHNQRNSDSGMYHYHHFSPCLNKNFLTGKTMGECSGHADCASDTTAWALSGYQDDGWNGKRVIGIAKDGHVLFGPHTASGAVWSPDDVDACNGAWSDDAEDFFYVSTQWHPYVSGCQGPTNAPHQVGMYPQCSLNGIDKYCTTTTTPTPTTTPTTSTQGCEDSAIWSLGRTRTGGERDCSWVSDQPARRCDKVDDAGITATNACRKSCGAC